MVRSLMISRVAVPSSSLRSIEGDHFHNIYSIPTSLYILNTVQRTFAAYIE